MDEVRGHWAWLRACHGVSLLLQFEQTINNVPPDWKVIIEHFESNKMKVILHT